MPVMTSHHPDAPPTYYRLSEETWAEIVEEYKNGATAKDLGAKWKVAPTSVYRHACAGGWSKKKCGDARARAHARMVEEEEQAHNALTPVGTRALKSLFQPAPSADPGAADPAALMKQATLAAGRAMRGRLWSEAQALAKLAESFARLDKEQRQSEEARTITYEKLPLSLVMDILEGGTLKVPHDIFIWPDKPDADLEHKRRWHRMDFYRRHGEDPPWWRGLKLSGVIVR